MDRHFALFLVHGGLVPLSFRQRCLEADLEELLAKQKRPQPPGDMTSKGPKEVKHVIRCILLHKSNNTCTSKSFCFC